MSDIFLNALRNVYRQVKALYYAGSRVSCPCCNKSFRFFLPFGVHPRANAMCPYCGSLERHRLLWLYLRQKTDFFQKKRIVLDIGPMEFFQKRCNRLSNLKYISVDIADPAVDIKLDVQHLPFTDNYFDAIICYHILEHVVDDCSALAELYRVLKPGGWAIIQSPVDNTRIKTFEDPSAVLNEERKRLFGQEDHLRIYGQDYAERLTRAGFSVRVDTFVRHMSGDVVGRFALQPDEDLYICYK